MTNNELPIPGRMRCRHVFGTSVKHYSVKVEVLKAMPDGKRFKVRVLTDRYGDTKRFPSTMYVPKSRVTMIIGGPQ